MSKSIEKIKSFINELKLSMNQEVYRPRLRVIEISKTELNEFVAVIQVINKNTAFEAYPEEILEDDSLVDLFSPRDVRTLTYLGYMGIHSPKYTILAKHLSEENNKIIFSIRKKGDKKIILRSALDLMNEQDIIASMSSVDSREVGYIAATENSADDFKQRKEILKNLIQNKAS